LQLKIKSLLNCCL